jgi:hypothetical protein
VVGNIIASFTIRGRSLRAQFAGAASYWCFHVTEKLPPPIPDGCASTVLPDAIVIGSRPGVALDNIAPLTVAPLKFTRPKSASGSTPPLLDGASAITSARVRVGPRILRIHLIPR